MHYVYLHGFASSPASVKAAFFRDRFAEVGITLEVPDLNQPAFRELTLTRILATVAGLVRRGEQAVIVGSSLGGYAAALFAARHPDRVAALVLMAPAFNMATLLRERHGDAAMRRWQIEGSAEVEHPAFDGPMPLDWSFQEDADQWARQELRVRCPTLILHGRHDPEVPLSGSERFAEGHPQVRLVALDSDHGLLDVLPELWGASQDFLAPWLRPAA